MSLSGPRVWTYEEVCALPSDGRRYEVIDGDLHVSPSPRSRHQLISRRLQFFLYQLETQGQGAVFNAPMDLLMPGCTPVQPDLIFLTREQLGMVQENFIEGIPALLVEILSPSTASYDRVKKLNRYARSGVPHYVVVDPDANTLESFILDGSTYRLEQALDQEDTWAVLGLQLPLRSLFAPLGEVSAP